MQYLATFVQYGLLTVGVLGATYIYRPDLVEGLMPSAPTTVDANNESSSTSIKKQKSRKPKPQKEPISSGQQEPRKSSEEVRTSKKRKIVGPVDEKVTATAIDGSKKELVRDTENDLTDKAFAQQLAQAQAGTKLQSKQQGNGASAKLAVAPASAQSLPQTFEAGQDEEGWSSVTSKAASSRDVSDMLEPAASGPKSLRLTNVEESKKPKAKSKHQEPAKEKKINARKQQEKEERARIDVEWERKKQQQIQTARMAEGSSKQQKANAFAASQKNAWTPNGSSAANNENGGSRASLLDTFQPEDGKQPSVQAKPLADVTNGIHTNNSVNYAKSELGEQVTTAMGASEREGGAWTEQSSVSEEEQLQRIREEQQEDAWEPVQSKKQKKGKKGTESSSDTSPPSSRAISQARSGRDATADGTQSTGATQSKQAQNTNRFATMQASQPNDLTEDEWQA